jgi:hypothetical protein
MVAPLDMLSLAPSILDLKLTVVYRQFHSASLPRAAVHALSPTALATAHPAT